MRAFNYYSPTNIVFGNGRISEIGNLINSECRKPLLVMNKGPFRQNGIYDQIKKYIVSSGRELIEMNDIDSNPRLSSAREGTRICKEKKADCIIAVGGGSAMDCAKVIGASAASGTDPYELLWGSKPEVTVSLPVIAVPTIAATGSECNPTAVIVNDETKEKYFCNCIHPVTTILDPELTLTVPLKLAIWGTMDILSHTFEYYFNGDTNSESQLRLSESIIHATMKALDDLVKNPDDVQARGELIWCSIMAWGGLTKIGRGEPDMACHGLEESFSGWFDTHHGACLGVLTPRWMDIVSKKIPEPFARFGRNIFYIEEKDNIKAAAAAVAEYKTWLKQVGAPDTYFDIGSKDFSDEDLKHVAETSCRIYNGAVGRLYKFDKEESLNLLKSGKVKL